jgi:putative ABC transport system permease protein
MVIIGLAAAFTMFLAVAIQCWYDFSYNGNFSNTDNIYLYEINDNGYKVSSIWLPREIEEIKQTYPDVSDICAINIQENTSQLYNSIIGEDGKETRFEDNSRIGITNGFFSFFNPKTIAGDATKLFTEPDKIVITASCAKKFFGDENPIGKVLKLGHIYRPYYEPLVTIIAVWEDFPENCSLKNGVYYDIGDNSEGDGCNRVFIKMKSNKSNLNTLAKRMAQGEHCSQEQRERMQEYYNSRNIDFIPFNKIHFSEIGEGNLTTTLSLLFVGIVALIIAYINFINFSIAIAPARVKSINIQKIFGAEIGLLRFIIVSEAVIFSMVAFGIAILFITLINNNIDLGEVLFSADLSLTNNLQLLTVLGFFTVVLGVGIGLYPAYYITSFKPVLFLSGSPTKSKRNVYVRNILTSVQFIISIILITVIFFIKRQHDYVVNYSYGMEKENIVYLSLYKLNNIKDREPFVAELKKNPQILDYTFSSALIGANYPEMNGRQSFSDIQMDFAGWRVTDNFLSFFGIPVIDGDNFLDSKSIAKNKAIINRKLIEISGQTDVIGKRLRNYEITGVINDVNFEDLHHAVRPMAFVVEYNDTQHEFMDYLYLKIADGNISKTISWIKGEVWTEFSSLPCEINSLNIHINNLYKKENNIANLLTIVCIIAIIIAIMGVYGMIVFNIRQKEKEIALRKIAGATVWDILLLLNRGALIQLIIAFVVAAPVAYYIANRWLENFAYKISIQWWVFVLCWLVMCAITVATICMQTYRAATKNPIEALKTE